jgi:enoyl-CoA hydratase/carnithine racemase
MPMTEPKAPTAVHYRTEDAVAFVELDGPQHLNAISDPTAFALRQALEDADGDPAVRAVVISGAGRAFCAGADVMRRHLRPREELIRLGNPQARGTLLDSYFFDFTHWKPVIAAVQGYAVGLGFLLALCCEYIVAAEDARFQVTEVSRGLDPSYHRALLAYRAGGSVADDLALSGRFFEAAEAQTRGVVERLVPVGQQLTEATRLAEQLASNPPLVMRGMVQQRRLLLQQAWTEARARGPRDLHLSEDFHESAMAFIEKRKPVFHGR